jgi:aryl-alcohol dehydrogenase-like predicted oxidoreductase
MQKRKLGKSGLEVSPLCLGGNVFGWTADEKTSHRLLDAFVDAGSNFIDTADVYSRWISGHQGGESETVIGTWLRQGGKRDKVVIATKVGLDMGSGKNGLGREHILRSVDESLRRLQTDYIDLYQAHRDDKDTPLEETLSAFDEVIRSGKVRAIGASNYTAGRLAEALDVSARSGFARYESLQPLYNLYDRDAYEPELEPVCTAHGLGVIPYYSLAAGFLTGKYRSKADAEGKARGGTVQKYVNDRGFRIVDAVERVAKEAGASPAQVALAWLMARPSITAPIASATRPEQLADLLGAEELNLGADTIERLNEASASSQSAAQA